MSLHITPPNTPELVDTLAVWRARYPRFADSVDKGESPIKALRYLGLSLWMDGSVDEAVSALATAAALAPDDTAILAELGSVLSLAGRKVDALNCFAAAAERDPNNPQIWLNVAGVCNELGEKVAAEDAFRAAIDLDPASAEAAAGLGLICLESRRYDEAIALLSAALARGVESATLYACYGQTLYLVGRFAEARAALERAAAALPDESAIMRKYALALFVETAIRDTPEAALAAWRQAVGPHADNETRAGRSVFRALCGFGREEAAIRFGEWLLRQTPDDPIISYHLDALRGRRCARASREYVAACFDRYAPDFDRHLVETLDYRLPETLQPLLAATGRSYPRILDLGCGTGLAARMLAGFGDEITGVDLSAGMLDLARGREIYARLIREDAVDFLCAPGERFDLIVALDMLIYLGDLSALVTGVAARLAPGGVFAFSIETGEGADYALTPSGRFTHDPAYVERLWTADFERLAEQPAMLRIEANLPVAGRLILLRRRGGL